MKIKGNQFFKICLMFVFVNGSAFAQADPFSTKQTLQYKEYLARISDNNLEYAAERYNLDIADAEMQAARVFPDPELSFGWGDNGHKRMQMGYAFEAELTWDLELGGKRKARKEVALSERRLAEFELTDFFQKLRSESTIAYLEAMQNKMLFDIQKDSYESMKQIAKSDSIRYSLGQISKVESIQSRLESKSMWNELVDAEVEWNNSLLEMKGFFSNTKDDTSYLPEGDFQKFDRLFDLEDLIITAQNNRADFLVAKQNQIVASSQVRLARAERVVDLGLSLGVENNSFVKNAVAPTPGNTTVSVGVSVPLKFSNRRDSGLRTALIEQRQVDLEYRDIELGLEREITQSYRNYVNKQKQIQLYENGMLEEAKEVLDGMKYSYQRGASSLLEVLEAQRTYNETQQAYAEALFDYASALVELEHAVGIWDIDF